MSLDIQDEKGQLKNLPNHYGRYKDKELIICYSVNRENFELGEEFVDKKANESRSLMQKYYCMVKYGTEYPEKETKRIYRYVHYRNQQNEKMYEQEIEKGYTGENALGKIVSEDVFYKYDYLFENDSSDSGNADAGDNWGEVIDFTIDKVFDIPTEDEVQNEPNNSVGEIQKKICKNDAHDKNNHELFCVAEKDLNFIDIDDLF